MLKRDFLCKSTIWITGNDIGYTGGSSSHMEKKYIIQHYLRHHLLYVINSVCILNSEREKTMAHKRLTSACLSCLTRGQLDKYPENISEEQQIMFKQKVLQILATAADNESAPMLVNKIDQLRMEMFGSNTDYSEIKQYFNEYVMKKQTRIEYEVVKAEDQLMRALQYAMTGNYIDFGAMESVSEEKFEELLVSAKFISLDEQEYKNLKNDLETAKTMVFLHDNCGEIVFDHVLIKTLKMLYPEMTITSMVRGFPVLNDATMDDARQIGLAETVEVMGNGSTVAGTCLEYISEEALKVIQNADVIISKGQGNFETLYGCGLNVYYLFMCKCNLFAERFHKKLFEGMLINDQSVR